MTYQIKDYKITNTKPYTKNVKLFRVKTKLSPLPGQFFQLSIPGIGECPLASCSYNSEYIDILVRNAGNVTSSLFKLKKEEKVWLRGPYGKGFPIEELQGKNIILIAGGTGIAPVTSLINYIEQNKKQFKDIKIFFGFKDEKNILLKERIKKWQEKFKVKICLEKTSNKKYFKGFVNQTIKNQKNILKNSAAVLCGPEIMMEAVTQELKNKGLKESEIYWSMERRMECAIGSCGRCLIQDVYTCKDGPVFRYDFIKPRLNAEKNSNEK
ncbi:FAD/NAD(P)-binding protein [Candidatus Pacearchaeota archaeon]|nr:FAD/NAD(P)-binding protein [Candidatus Pacearchaeota archaeon]